MKVEIEKGVNPMKNKINYLLIIPLLILTFLTANNFVQAQELPFHGFVETAIGGRYDSADYLEDDLTLSEIRAQLEYGAFLGPDGEFQVKADIIKDTFSEETDIELREGYIWLYPSRNFEIKAGRQILTWGTGDLLFINDLFPKDYRSFFIGRDQEYLKAPTNAIKTSFFPKGAIVDVVFMPTFTSDEYVTGERLAYFSQSRGKMTEQEYSANVEEPAKDWSNSELALRVKKNYKDHELALYGYRGFHKQPTTESLQSNKMIFPRLNVYGASWRNRLLGGITSAEIGYYDSRSDNAASQITIPNDYWKALVGYNKDLDNNLRIGFQYYLEQMQNYREYENNLPANYEYKQEENRHVTTLRITKELYRQTLKLDLFTFYSLSDEDGYLRPTVSYDWTDNINLSAGGNVFFGDENYTQYASMEDNSNLYLRLRYSY